MFDLTNEVFNIVKEQFIFAKEIRDKIADEHPEIIGPGKGYEDIGKLGKGVAAVCYNLTKKGKFITDGTKYPAPARYQRAPNITPTKQEIMEMLNDLKSEMDRRIGDIKNALLAIQDF